MMPPPSSFQPSKVPSDAALLWTVKISDESEESDGRHGINVSDIRDVSDISGRSDVSNGGDVSDSRDGSGEFLMGKVFPASSACALPQHLLPLCSFGHYWKISVFSSFKHMASC